MYIAVYDASSAVGTRFSDRRAIPIAGQSRLHAIQPRHWVQHSRDCGIDPGRDPGHRPAAAPGPAGRDHDRPRAGPDRRRERAAVGRRPARRADDRAGAQARPGVCPAGCDTGAAADDRNDVNGRRPKTHTAALACHATSSASDQDLKRDETQCKEYLRASGPARTCAHAPGMRPNAHCVSHTRCLPKSPFRLVCILRRSQQNALLIGTFATRKSIEF